VDWNIGQNDRVFFRVQEEGGIADDGDDPISSVFDSDLDNRRWQGQLLETHTFSPATAAQFLVGVSDHSLARSTSRNVRVQNSVESALPFALNSALPASR
jgi:hypothetical protein